MDDTCRVDIELSVDNDTRLSLSDEEISIYKDDWATPVVIAATNISDESENTDAVVTITALIESNSEYYGGFEAQREIEVTDISSGDISAATYSGGSNTITAGQGETITINGSNFKRTLK